MVKNSGPAKLLFFISILFLCLFSGVVPASAEDASFSFGRLGVNIPPDTLSAKGRPAAMPSTVVYNQNVLKFENTHYFLQFDTTPSLTLTRLYNKYTQTECLTKENPSSRLFFLWVDGKRLETKDFKVEGCRVSGQKAVISLSCPQEGVSGELTVAADNSSELSVSASFANLKKMEREFRFLLPYFEHLSVGDNLKDNYYFFPLKGGWCGNNQYRLVCAYGGVTGSIQLVSLFNPTLGGGFYTYLKDNTGRPKTIYLEKRDRPNRNIPTYDSNWPEYKLTDDIWSLDAGANIGFYSWPYKVKPAQVIILPEVVLGVYAGDVKVPLASYKKWAHTWFKPLNTPQWYKDDFCYIVSHDRAGGPGYEKGFVRDNKIILSELAKPYDHYLQLAYWGRHSNTNFEGDTRDYKWYRHTIGNYDYEETWGGLPALREEIKKAQENGPRIVLYGATPYMAWKYSKVYGEHPDWALLDEKGAPVHDYWGVMDPTPGVGEYRYVDMCPQVEGWQDWMAETNRRIIADTGAGGVYLDTMDLVRYCYSKDHKHYEYPQAAAETVLKKIVAAVRSADPEATVDVETMNSDYLMQWIDGSWETTFSSYQVLNPSQKNDYFDLYSTNFFHFLFPEVKLTEFAVSFKDGARRAFFNGLGIIKNTVEAGAFTDETTGRIVSVDQQLDYFTVTGALMKENGDAFSSLSMECLVPTLQKNIFANQFPAKDKTLYTLYNKNDQKIAGPVLRATPAAGYHCVELLYDNEVSFDPKTGDISASIPSWEAVCIAKFPEMMEVNQDKNNVISVKVTGKLSAPSLRIFLDRDTGKEKGKEIILKNNRATVDLKELRSRKIILKLFEGNYLCDERVVES